jgi:hypothetical protein
MFMRNKKLLLGLLAVLLTFGSVFTATAQSNSEIFNSWIGSHYTKLSGKIPGRVSYNGNSVTYDSSWNEIKSRYAPRGGRSGGIAGSGTESLATPYYEDYQVYHERWITFYFDKNGIITTWRSKGY